MAGAEERGLLTSTGATRSLPTSAKTQLADGELRVVVLGATGWLGMIALDVLQSALGSRFLRQVSAWASRERVVTLRSGVEVPVRDLRDAQPDDVAGAIVLHFAFLTRDRVAALGVEPYLRTNLEITHRVLSLVGAEAPRALVYASSGAVYDGTGGFAADVLENPYGAAKRLDELAFRTACADVGASCVIPRVFSISGPYMTKPELYALGDLILQAARGDRLQVRAARPVYRSFVAGGDLVAVCLSAALEDKQDLVFDSGGVVAEVGELAALVQQQAARPGLAIDRTWDPAAEADHYVADPMAMEHLAAHFEVPLLSLPDQVAETAADLLEGS